MLDMSASSSSFFTPIVDSPVSSGVVGVRDGDGDGHGDGHGHDNLEAASPEPGPAPNQPQPQPQPATPTTTTNTINKTTTTTQATPKPTLILLTPQNDPTFHHRWRQTLHKLSRETTLHTAQTTTTLNQLLETTRPTLTAIIVTSARIMRQTARNEALSHRLSQIVAEGCGWRVVFGFDFAGQACAQPMVVSRYWDNFFDLGWRVVGRSHERMRLGVSGVKRGEVRRGVRRLRLRLRRGDGVVGGNGDGDVWWRKGSLGLRVYRRVYSVRCVFLRNVDVADKVLVTTGEFPVGGQVVFPGEEGEGEDSDEAPTESTDSDFDFDVDGDDDKEEENGISAPAPASAPLAAPTLNPPSTSPSTQNESIFTTSLSSTPSPITTAPEEESEEEGGNGFPEFAMPEAEDEWEEFLDIEQIPADEGYATIGEGSNHSEGGDNDGNPGNEADDEGDHDMVDVDNEANNNNEHNNGNGNEHGPANANTGHHNDNETATKSDENEEDEEEEEEGVINKRFGNCPAAIHTYTETTTNAAGNQEKRVLGSVAFLGQVADNRSLASVLLGMCGVSSEVVQRYARESEDRIEE